MKVSKGRILFQTINYVIMILLAVICLFPLLNVLAMSFSSATAVSAGKVSILPVDFTASAYTYVMKRKEFWVSLVKSIERVCIGVPLSMMITILTAYPLSKEPRRLRARSVYAWLFFFTMLVFWRFDSWLSSDSEITPDGYDLGDGFADHGICVQYRADAELFQRNTGRARGSCTDGWSRAVSYLFSDLCSLCAAIHRNSDFVQLYYPVEQLF